MNYTVYGFNDSYPLYLALNGLRHYFDSSTWGSIIFLTVSVLLVIGVLTVQQRSILGYGRAYAGPLLLYCLLFISTAQIRIQDEWSGQAYTVDKMPLAIALPLSAVTTVEKGMLDIVEQYVTPPHSTSFKDFDFFMEASALGQILNGQSISNFEALASVGRYYDDCILKGIASGFISESKYHRSSNLVVDSYAPWGVYFTEITHSDGRTTVHTCKEAYSILFASVSNEAVNTGPTGMAAYMSTLFEGRHQNIADTVSAMDSLANTMFPGHQSTSDTVFKQAFMINGLESNLARTSPQLLAVISQAEAAQATGLAAASAVYIKKLPKLRAMAKLLVVCLLPVVGAFFIAQSSRPFLHWCVALLSVSMWLPIMACIKGVYIVSAINELHGLTLSTGGLTIPNKGRILTWISDTATVAGSLAFMIPMFTALIMQIIAPKLASLASGVAGLTRGAEGFSQRAGMQALAGAERTAKELELDKINAAFMEAGDSHLMRNQRMNELISWHHNVAYARNTGTSPLQYSGTNTSAIQGQGYTISGGVDGRSSQISQEAVAMQQAKLETAQASAAYALSTGNGVSKGESDYKRFESSLDHSQRQSFSEVEQSVAGYVQKAFSSQGLSAEQAAQATRSISAGIHAGVSFDTGKTLWGGAAQSLTGVSVNAGASAEGRTATAVSEAQRAQLATQAAVEAMSNDQKLTDYQQSRAESLSHARRLGSGQEWASTDTRQESFSTQMQKVDSAWQSLSATKTAMSQQQSSLSATAGRSVNTGDLLAVTSRGDLEILAMDQGMARLRGALDRGVTSIDDLRIAANADMSTLLRQTDAGNAGALKSAMNGLDVIAGSGQYNAQDAAIAHQILQDRHALSSMAAGSGLPSFGQAAGRAASSLSGKSQDVATAGASAGKADLSRDPAGNLTLGSGSELKTDYVAKSQRIKAANQEDRQAIHEMGEESVKGMTEVDHTKTALENMGFGGGTPETDKLLERMAETKK